MNRLYSSEAAGGNGSAVLELPFHRLTELWSSTITKDELYNRYHILIFIPCLEKYSQSEARITVAYSAVWNGLY